MSIRVGVLLASNTGDDNLALEQIRSGATKCIICIDHSNLDLRAVECGGMRWNAVLRKRVWSERSSPERVGQSRFLELR